MTILIEKGLYYATPEFVKFVQAQGGSWNDIKHRPIVCLIESTECSGLFWAIPMGKFDHRDTAQQQRIQDYIDCDTTDIRSCYYHIGRTTSKSIFFISDAIPITDEFIAEEHIGPDGIPFVIKNPKLISELNRKLLRILSDENSMPNKYRQHITDVKTALIKKLSSHET